jgi:hypothetical protein
VIEIGEDMEALGDDVVRPLALHMGDEAHAAAVMLAQRIIKPLPRRRSGALEA